MAKPPRKRRRAEGALAGPSTPLPPLQHPPPDPPGAGPLEISRGVPPVMLQSLMEKTTAPEPLTIVPTLYPEDPTAALIVRDYVLIDARSPEFGELNAKLDVIIDLLHQSNQISGEVRDQLIAHIQAGRTILAAPKPDRNLIGSFWFIR